MRAVLVALLLLTACDSGGTSSPLPSTATPPSNTGATSTTATPATGAHSPTTAPSSSGGGSTAASAAQQALARMTLRERIGQLLMIDCPSGGVSDATVSAVQQYHAGSVILDGNSTAGAAAIRALTRQLAGLAPPRVGLFVATDQEGGQVQRLQGPGFSTIPSAVAQGGIDPASLRARAATWGKQLHDAGVNLNLAPVLDTVPPGGGPNPPIGDLGRQYGSTPKAVRTHGVAVAQGFADAGVDATVKHFPGLGRVSGNTDLTSGVKDTVTTRNDPYLAPFRAAVQQGVPFVMISTAIYTRIDPANPAAFSKTVITGMLRGDLGFRGVVISDDVGAAKQVSYLTPGQRAVAFVAAGGDVVLTVNAGQAGDMAAALLARASSDQTFRALVDAAALRVLQAKQVRGLLR